MLCLAGLHFRGLLSANSISWIVAVVCSDLSLKGKWFCGLRAAMLQSDDVLLKDSLLR